MTNQVNGETPETTTTTEGTTPEVASMPTPEEWAETKAQLAKLATENEGARARLSAANGEAAASRIKNKEAQEEKIAALVKNGEYQEALKLHEAQLLGLEGFKSDAEKWKAYETKTAEKIEAELVEGDLPGFVKTAVDRIPDIVGKRAFLDEFRNSVSNAPAAVKPSTAGTPPANSNGATDWATLNTQGGEVLENAIRADRAGWQSHLANRGGVRKSSH